MVVNQGTLHSFVTNVSEKIFNGQCQLEVEVESIFSSQIM